VANALYPTAKQAFGQGLIVWKASGGSTIKGILVDTGTYTYSSAHQYRSSLSGTVGSAFTLTLIDCDATGAFDAADITDSSVTGVSAEAIVLYKDTGNSATDILIAYIDSATGLPVTPNGGDIVIQWDNGSSKIFRWV